MSTIAIMQPYIFPYLGYYQLVRAVDTFVFFDDVQFKRRSYITRNSILGSDGPLQFSVPVQKGKREDPINAIRLHHGEYDKWKEKFLKSLVHAYKQAPHFEETYDLMEDVLDFPTDQVGSLAEESIRAICRFLGMELSFLQSSSINYDRSGSGQEKILSICEKLNANTYINAINGRNLYTDDDFDKEGIQLRFLEPLLKDYQQFNKEFVSQLSIIDILMFLDKENVKGHLNNFQLLTN